MKRGIVKTCMFLSSYFPLYIMLLLLHYKKILSIHRQASIKIILFLTILILAISISIISSLIILKSFGSKILLVKDVERPDDTIISYMMTYIIPILSVNFQDYGVIAVNFIMFILIGYLYIRLNLLYLNPLWSLAGFLSYRINDNVVVITNIKYIELKRMKELRGYYISNDIFVAKKRNNM